MADITFMCPKCRGSLSVDKSGAGQEVSCPLCGKQIGIPAPLSTKHIIQGCLVGVVVIALVTGGLLMLYGNSVYVTESGKTYHADRNCISIMCSTNVKTANSLICSMKGLRECNICQMHPKKNNEDIANGDDTAYPTNAERQYELGLSCHINAKNAEGKAEAAKWYLKAAEQGHAEAQYFLGGMYEEGEGVVENDVEAVRWYRESAAQGNDGAQFCLGTMYKYGYGVRKNAAKAMKWFQKAAEQGDARFQYILGNEYANFEDWTNATTWYRKAAEQGNAEAQKALDALSR